MDWLEIKEFLKDSIKVIICVVAFMVIVVYVFSIAQVVGNSMYPTLQNKELFILDKLHYRIKDIERGDIISLQYDDTKYLIKRVIGLPGDSIYIKDNKVYINDKIYEEKYISSDLHYSDFDLKEKFGYDKIPEDMYFVLGDNRENSKDSREIGLVKKSDIDGKISVRIWPINKFKIIKT